MRKFILLSLIGITSIAFTQPGWAAGHGGGGGGFHGGGFSGGHFGGGGGLRGGGFRGGGGFNAPRGSFGVGSRGGGVGFGVPRYSSFGTRPSYRQPAYNGRVGQSVTHAARATTASDR